MKKIIMALLLLIGIIGFSDEEAGYKGYNLPFTSDGKLHEEILLKRTITADDTSIEIKKLKNGKYQFWDYAMYDADDTEAPRISDAVVEKNVLCDEYICVGYDTKLKDPVILNRKTKRIISIVSKEGDNQMDDPETLRRFPEDNPEMYKLYRDYYKLYK